MLPILISSLAAGPIATAIMLAALYLPRVWGGTGFDVLMALGSAVTKELEPRSRLVGAVLYFAGGAVFALLYGGIAYLILTSSQDIRVPLFPLEIGPTDDINLLFPVLGIPLGFAHGLIVSLFGAVVVLEHHPFDEFRTGYRLVASQIVSHVIFGAAVMFFHHLFLQVLLGF